MSDKETRLFTVDEANRMLPLLSAIVKDLSELSLRVSERRQRISQLGDDYHDSTDNPYAEELAQIKLHLQDSEKDLVRFQHELDQLGVECENELDGFIDFPSQLDGRPIYLCWQLGEPEVLHWHEVDGGFEDRQRLAALADS